ncbi:MAG: Gfo/Idh/MocA family oxidoreductase [Saprospiraceae bacterium]
MLNRRHFIEKLALGSGTLILTKANPSFLEEKKLGIALVGLGNYATNQLAPALLETLNCKLTGIVTGTPAKEEKWAKQYNIPKKNIYNYQNFDTIKNNPDIDIVYVVLPNAMHAEYTIRAAKAGKHVICEKPMALNVQECKEMIKACNDHKVKLSVGYRLYFEPHHLEMRRLGTEKVYGSVRMIESSLGFSMADPKIWRLNKALGGGGAIMDLGVYCIQGARRTIGELPVSVTAQGFIRDKTIFKDIYEGITFQMNFPSGAISNSTTTYTSYVDRLHATTGYQWYTLQPSFNATGAKGEFLNDNKAQPMSFKTKAFQQIDQMDDFVKCIRENKVSIASGEEGMTDLKIIEAIKESADRGGTVKLMW